MANLDIGDAKDGANNVHRLEARQPEPSARPAGAEPREGSDNNPKERGKSRRWKRTILFGLLPVALVVGGYAYVTGGATMSTDNAYVQADTVGVSTDISGIVSQVLVHDNQQVARNEPLFRLDPLPFQLALDRANAEIGDVRNQLVAMQANYRDMQAQIEQSKATVGLDKLTVKRQQELAVNKFTPQATLDSASATLQVDQQKTASLIQQLAGIAANLNGDPDAPVENHPRYKSAVAARDEAARQLSHATVRAPFAGVVTNVPQLQPGQYLAAASTAFNIVSSDDVWVQASPKETELTYVKPGQRVDVEVDTYPGVVWTGTVESISPASASSFSLLPAENTSGNWVKVVQRIPMRVKVDQSDDKPALRIGMSAEISVSTGHERGLPTFFTALFTRQDQRHG